jgi:preprotein translocase subunit SecG
VRRALTTWLSLALLAMLVLAPAAAAENDGRGFYGATNDKVVTDAGFIIIAFFPLLVLVLSMLQRRLDKRKQARKAAAAQLGASQWRGGW